MMTKMRMRKATIYNRSMKELMNMDGIHTIWENGETTNRMDKERK